MPIAASAIDASALRRRGEHAQRFGRQRDGQPLALGDVRSRIRLAEKSARSGTCGRASGVSVRAAERRRGNRAASDAGPRPRSASLGSTSRTRISSGRSPSCTAVPRAKPAIVVAGELERADPQPRPARRRSRRGSSWCRRNRRRRRSPACGRSRPACRPARSRRWFITTMRSAMASASSWSCVTMMVVTPSRCCSARISSRRRTRTRASSAESGSSSSSRPGEVASARASATRCCWPPESCAGYFAPCSGRPTSASSSATRALDLGRAFAAVDEAVADVVRRRSGSGTARRTGTRCRSRAPPAAARETSRPAISMRALVLRVEAGDGAQQRGLAAAGRPEEADELAAPDLEIDRLQGGEGAEALPQALDAQKRLLGHRRGITTVMSFRGPAKRRARNARRVTHAAPLREARPLLTLSAVSRGGLGSATLPAPHPEVRASELTGPCRCGTHHRRVFEAPRRPRPRQHEAIERGPITPASPGQGSE